MNFVNEVRTMHCSRVVYCPNTNGNLYVALIYPTGTAGTMQLLSNSYIRLTRIA